MGVVAWLLLVAPSAYYPHAGNLDEWCYVGFGEHYLENPDFYSNYYKVSRLPWILAVGVFYGLLPWQVAALVVAGCYLAAISALSYLLLRRITGDLTAFALSVVFTFLPASGGSGGWVYHNMAAGPLLLLTLLVTIRGFRASEARYGWWCGLCGALFALTLHSNIVFVNLAPLVLAVGLFSYFHSGGGRAMVRRLAVTAASGFAGAVAATGVLSAIAVATGRRFDFWSLQFDLAASFVADNSNQTTWWKPLSIGWIVESPHLLFPCAVAVGSILWLTVLALQGVTSVRPIRTTLPRAILVVQFQYSFGLWVVWQIMGQTALDWSYFTYPLNFSALVGLGAMLGGGERVGMAMGRKVILVVFVVIGLAFPDAYSAIRYGLGGAAWPVGLFLASGFLLVAVFATRWRIASEPLFVGLFFVALAFPDVRMASYERGDPENRVAMDETRLVFSLRDQLGDDFTEDANDIFVWYDEEEPFSAVAKDGDPAPVSEVIAKLPLGDSIASFLLTGFKALPRAPEVELDELADDAWQTVNLREAGDRIVLVTTQDDAPERLIERLRKLGMTYRIEREDVVETEFLKVPFVVLAAEFEPEAARRERLQRALAVATEAERSETATRDEKRALRKDKQRLREELQTPALVAEPDARVP